MLAAGGTGPADGTKTPAVTGLLFSLQQESRQAGYHACQEVVHFSILDYHGSGKQNQQYQANQDEEGTQTVKSLHFFK